MRVTLMHNPKAGRGKHRKKDLMTHLAEAGHEVIYQSTKNKDYKKALKKSTDLVLIAGGDGTITRVAARLIDSGIPLSVLPLGTANNLARSLGFTKKPEQIIAQLDDGKRRAFDVGIACGPWGKRYFFEGAGAGLLTDYVQATREKKESGKKISKEEEMRRHVSLLWRMSQQYRAREWEIELDGKDISDRYILWEAMNIRSIGPALYLAPGAAIKDGKFDFVRVREDDRPLLVKHLNARLAGKKSKFPLPIRRFRQLKIIWKKSAIRFDDKIWPDKKQRLTGPSEIEISVRPSALLILQPTNG